MLKGALKTVNEWLELVIDLLKTLIVVGIVVGILFDDFFWSYRRIRSYYGPVWRRRFCRNTRINDSRYVV